jgi:uroporphyrinogen-III synthase
MSRPIAVLRPEPGNRVTAAAIEATGRKAIRLPLFEARPVAWDAPEARRYDALILTSANAVRHGGPGLAGLLALPVYAVGAVTAEAARREGFRIALTGEAGAEQLLARAEAAGVARALHLAGRERSIEAGGIVADVRTVYASETLPIAAAEAAGLAGTVAIVQSARTGARLAEIAPDRSSIALVAISRRAAEAAGGGWKAVIVPADFGPKGLIEAAIALAD